MGSYAGVICEMTTTPEYKFTALQGQIIGVGKSAGEAINNCIGGIGKNDRNLSWITPNPNGHLAKGWKKLKVKHQ